jgi:putative endonuclease
MGETLVAQHLEGLGFEILARNARTGRLEIDLIARRDQLVVFCEVRSRRSDSIVGPFETIDRLKIARLRRAASQWLAANPQPRAEIRFDAASVVFDRTPPRLEYFEFAF